MVAGTVSQTFELEMLLEPSIQGKVVRIVFGKSVGDVTHDSVAQAKEIDRKITAIFTLCLTEVAN